MSHLSLNNDSINNQGLFHCTQFPHTSKMKSEGPQLLQMGSRLVSVPDPKLTPARITFSIERFPVRYTGSDIHAGWGLGTRLGADLRTRPWEEKSEQGLTWDFSTVHRTTGSGGESWTILLLCRRHHLHASCFFNTRWPWSIERSSTFAQLMRHHHYQQNSTHTHANSMAVKESTLLQRALKFLKVIVMQNVANNSPPKRNKHYWAEACIIITCNWIVIVVHMPRH